MNKTFLYISLAIFLVCILKVYDEGLDNGCGSRCHKFNDDCKSCCEESPEDDVCKSL